MDTVDELIRQIRLASEAGLFYLALLGALALPDICGALASKEGTASGSKYRDWLEKNVPAQAPQADLIYELRCSLLHQGRARPAGGHPRIAFTYSGSGAEIHNLSMVTEGDPASEVGWISISMFVQEVTNGAEHWMQQFGETKRVKRNLEKFARLRPEGLPPFVAGAGVIA
ncbi:MAG: hypothetical protein M3R70_06310 [Actinomycetota bacterium]|nr:hypothetical protein [Actinomycetota bacterium]